MNETEFNLLDEPWIRVMDDNCQIKEVSLTDALLNAHKYKALKGEMPTQDIVVLRLMLAIVHTVFSRVDADGNEAELEEEDDAVDRWESLWNNRKIPEKPVREYLEKWHERFWLFHPERPFGQMAGLTYGTEYGASKLNGEISESGNKTRIFSAYSGEQKSHLTYAQAARWLLYVNSFDDTSAKPTKEGKAIAGGKLPSPGAGWLGKLGIVYLNGKNLFETLMLNLVLINNDNVESEEHPLWERDVPPTSERREIPYPTNLAELYTLQSRRMLLKREENYVIGYYLIGGDFFAKENAFVEPMTVWRTPSKASDPYNPKRHDSAKQMWREFSVLYDNADNNHVAGIIKWFKFISSKVKLPIMNTAIVSVQYGDKDFFVQNVFGDSLEMNAQILSEVGRGYREEIKFEISRCEELADKISRLAGNLYLASGGTTGSKTAPDKTYRSTKTNAKSQLYYRLDIPFRSWLSSLDPENDDKQEKFEQWQDIAKRITLDLGSELVAAAGDTAMVGHKIDKTIYSAPKVYNSFLRDVSKIYKEI